MNCKTFKSRPIHNLPVCLHFTVFKPSNRGWNLTAGIWFYSAIRALVRSTGGQQTKGHHHIQNSLSGKHFFFGEKYHYRMSLNER